MQHHLRVAAGLKDGALADQLVSQLAGVDQIAVVADGNLPVRALDQNGLRVGQAAFAASIPDMADGAWCRAAWESVAPSNVSAT